MKAELFLISYEPDYQFAEYCLKSVQKFGSGFAGITIVVPTQDEHKFKYLAQKYDATLRSYYVAAGKGFLHHEVCKCEADLWIPKDRDLVVHIDSDCIFQHKFSLDTFMHEGKPILLREHFEDFRHYDHRYSWKSCVDRALGCNMEWETMVRHPSVFHVDLYPRMRSHIEQRHRMPFTQYVLLQREEFPQTFTEFPTLGAYSLINDADRYQVVTRVVTPGPYWEGPRWGVKPMQRQANNQPVGTFDPIHIWHHGDAHTVAPLDYPIHYFWSRRGVTPEIRAKIEQILA